MKILKAIALLLIALILVISFNTFRFTSKQVEVNSVEPYPIRTSSVRNFSNSLKIKTISHEEPEKFDAQEFERFNQFLATTYPQVFQQLEHQTFLNYSHLFKWQGSDNSLKPIILVGHLDVVPIAAPEKWNVDPFSGVIEDGVIYGRGTIDDKLSVIGLLEAISHLLDENFQPQRTIYLAFGHDEEIGGTGAQAIASYLQEQQVEAEFVLDEGLAITQKIIPGLDKDVALIGIAEKGFTTLELTVDMSGGHSSMPAKESAIDVLATAVSKLKSNPLPRRFSPPMQGFMEYIGPEMSGLNKVAFANQWLFKPLILNTYEEMASGNALIRTTTSPTMFNAGIKENVIPRNARALVNYRILPGESIESVMEYAKQTVNDPRIEFDTLRFNSNPSNVSPTDNKAYATIRQSIQEVYPNTIVGPNLVVGATDARHYEQISDSVYRFLPYKINQDNINTFHGANERISVDDYLDAIRFYMQVIKNSQ